MSANHLDVVRAVKAELEAAGVNLSGACGAFRILNRVARRLQPEFGLLRKAGGNRAVPQLDGSCLSGDETSDAGYATDYLIERTTFFGYDILGDGGGANTPQWPDEPETDLEMVRRNRANFAEPLAWGEAPSPPPSPPSAPPPPPPPPLDLTIAVMNLTKAALALKTAIESHESMAVMRHADLVAQLEALNTHVAQLQDGTITQRILGVGAVHLGPPNK
jgi:hypothetical protein